MKVSAARMQGAVANTRIGTSRAFVRSALACSAGRGPRRGRDATWSGHCFLTRPRHVPRDRCATAAATLVWAGRLVSLPPLSDRGAEGKLRDGGSPSRQDKPPHASGQGGSDEPDMSVGLRLGGTLARPRPPGCTAEQAEAQRNRTGDVQTWAFPHLQSNPRSGLPHAQVSPVQGSPDANATAQPVLRLETSRRKSPRQPFPTCIAF